MLIYADLLDLYLNGGNPAHDEAQTLLDEAVLHHGDDPLIQWNQARLRLEFGDVNAARSNLISLLSAGPEGPPPAAVGYDKRLFGEWPLGLLGTVCLRDGQTHEAVDWFSQALLINPANSEVSTKLQLARARANS